jgi:hypothetical protein
MLPESLSDGEKTIKNLYRDGIDDAYDLSSSGMAMHVLAIKEMLAKGNTSGIYRENVLCYDSNYLCNDYAWIWNSPQINPAISFRPQYFTPRDEAHLRLLNHTKSEYNQIRTAMIRLYLSGEDALKSPEIWSEFSDGEFWKLLKIAKDRNILPIENNQIYHVGKTNSFGVLMVNLKYAGVQIEKISLALADETKCNPFFYERVKKASIHKLGCILAFTDQIVYDAYTIGTPISPEYHPKSHGWPRIFGEPVPGIQDLYQHSQQYFTQIADTDDTLTRHLLTLTNLTGWE